MGRGCNCVCNCVRVCKRVKGRETDEIKQRAINGLGELKPRFQDFKTDCLCFLYYTLHFSRMFIVNVNVPYSRPDFPISAWYHAFQKLSHKTKFFHITPIHCILLLSMTRFIEIFF